MKKSKSCDFPINGVSMWFFYIVGWVFGVFNLFFWLVELFVGIFSEDKNKFINKTFHLVVYYFGIFYFVMISLFILLLILGFSLPFLMMH